MSQVVIEPVDVINRRLKENYGETEEQGDRLPNYRIVWSEDQWEMRRTQFTDEGFQLIRPEVRRLPKYRQWVKEKHVLERLTLVPTINEHDLPESKLSYEPIWVFEDRKGLALPPAWSMARFVVDGIQKKIEQAGHYARYRDHNESKEELDARLKEIESYLYMNESEVGDALATKNAISMAGLDGRSKAEESK